MKSYPKTKFDLVNQTSIQEINTNTASAEPVALFMQPYTSDKGTEDWELMNGFDNFVKAKGSISFMRHGQGLLTVAEALRNGAYVFGKRMVSEDATLANVTVRARVVVSDSVSYLYLYTSSFENIKTFDEACNVKALTNEELKTVNNARVDVPLFTVTPLGRGESSMFFTVTPVYATSKSANTIKYIFSVYENNECLESITFSMNPEVISDSVSQSLSQRVRANSKQVKVKIYEEELYELMKALAETAVSSVTDPNKVSLTEGNLINMDFINSFDVKGKTTIPGIVTMAQSTGKNDQWLANKPTDIKQVYNLVSDNNGKGVPLVNGSFGTMTSSPMSKPEEYEKMLLKVFNAYTTDSVTSTDSETDDHNQVHKEKETLYDPIIYDLDANKIDAIFDCNWPVSVKNAIANLIDFRGDMVFLADLGTTASTLEDIKDVANSINPTKFMALYHNYFKINDPYSKKEITVTMPFLLIDKLITHIAEGVGRPFAGYMNNVYFTNIIENTINFIPVDVPGCDQKQELVDSNINYISYYNNVPIMETMYTNDSEYTKLSYLHNIMAIQEIIKVIRDECPRIRYAFLDGNDLEAYLTDVTALVNEYSSNFESISVQYMADNAYEDNNIFYAVLKVQFRNFVQEEYFKIIAIS